MSAALAPTVDEVVGHSEHGGGRRTRVAAWATAGAVAASLGSLALVAGASAEGVLYPYATDPDACRSKPGARSAGSSLAQVSPARDTPVPTI